MKCNKCRIEKEKSNFFKAQTNKKRNGLSSWCKSCFSFYMKKWRNKNRKKIREYERKYKKIL